MTCECLIAEKSRTWLICHLRRLLAKTCQTITDCLFDGQRVGREVLSLDEIFPIHKANETLRFGKYKGKTIADVYKADARYLHWLETTDRFLKIDFEELKRLYPDIERHSDVPILERTIGFGKYKGKRYGDIKDDIPYLEWLVSIDEITMEDFKLITKN